jgi:hypothetical protein
LGKGVGVVGVEEGVEVHIEGQGQAVGFEGAGEEVQMRQNPWLKNAEIGPIKR